MKKDCVLLDGKIINIGPWDYRVERVLSNPGEAEPVYKDIPKNPLPDGAVVVELDIAQNDEGGWYAVDYQPVKDPSETELLGQQLTQVKLQSIQQQQMITSLGAELAATKLELINLKGADQV